MSFGKFPDFETFLDHYKAIEQRELDLFLATQPRDQQLETLRQSKPRDVVEVNAIIVEHQPDGVDSSRVHHYHLIIHVTDAKLIDPDVQKDVNRCIQQKAAVFIAIRYGDKLGISTPIKKGLSVNDKLDLKGEWIPADKAYSNGGEKMSVLHFTHKPIGFVCTMEKCYQ
jgi:hypothetical protein